jgi:hypothetical protein
LRISGRLGWKAIGLITLSYRFPEVVHRLGRRPRRPALATAGEQLRRRPAFCYFQSDRRYERNALSRSTNLSQLFDGGRTQSYSHAFSDAGSSCLALYDLQPVTDHSKTSNNAYDRNQ